MIQPRASFLLESFKFVLISLIALTLQSCLKEEIGKDLANSFDEPSKSETTQEIYNEKKKVRLNNDRQNISNAKPSTKEIKVYKEPIVPFDPQPYRIIIKLSSANPSAPAESVTKALRRAGVKFEVEKIELLDINLLQSNIPSKRLKR